MGKSDLATMPDPVESVTAYNTDAETRLTMSDEYRSMVEWYFDEFPATASNPDIVQAQILDRLDTVDGLDILDVPESLDSASLFANQVIELGEVVSVQPSDYDPNGIFVTVLIRKSDQDAAQPMTMGSPNLLKQYQVLHRSDNIPIRVRIVPVKKAKQGRNPTMYFRRAD